jgi:hypothetical protein
MPTRQSATRRVRKSHLKSAPPLYEPIDQFSAETIADLSFLSPLMHRMLTLQLDELLHTYGPRIGSKNVADVEELACERFDQVARPCYAYWNEAELKTAEFVETLSRIELIVLEEIRRSVSEEILRPSLPNVKEILAGRIASFTQKARRLEIIRIGLDLAKERWDTRSENEGQKTPSESETAKQVAGANELKSESRRTKKTPGKPSAGASFFPNRAAWLKREMESRKLSASAMYNENGPDRKSIRKVLDGFAVSDGVLTKLLQVLSKHGDRLSPKDIPTT